MHWTTILGVRDTDKYPETIKKGRAPIKSDEVVIKEINDLMALDPKITRNKLCKAVHVALPRLLALAEKGLIKIPAKVSRSQFHLYTAKTKNHPWR